MMICKNCKASKHIKESLGCNCDKIHNNLEVIKGELLKTFKVDYEPKFQCRFADLVEENNYEI